MGKSRFKLRLRLPCKGTRFSKDYNNIPSQANSKQPPRFTRCRQIIAFFRVIRRRRRRQ